MSEIEKNVAAPTTLSSSSHGELISNRIVESKYFENNIAVFRFAIALAINEDLLKKNTEIQSNGDGQTWGLSSVDPNGLLKYTIREFVFAGNLEVSDREIYKTAERLADLGLARMEEYSKQGESYWEYLDPKD